MGAAVALPSTYADLVSRRPGRRFERAEAFFYDPDDYPQALLAGDGLAPIVALVPPDGQRVERDVLSGLSSLRLVSFAGTGVWDHIDLAEASARGVAVANVPGYASSTVAEYTMAVMLALVRDVVSSDASVRGGGWTAAVRPGLELRGRTLGIIGLGAIGCRVAELGRAFGMHVIAVVRHQYRRAGAAEVVPLANLLKRADIVSLHASFRDPSRGPLLGPVEIRAMRPGALLINTARGGLVDMDALVAALTDGHLAGAALDVFRDEPLPLDHPLRRVRNVLLSPHCAARTVEAIRRAHIGAVRNVAAFLDGRPIHNIAPVVGAG